MTLDRVTLDRSSPLPLFFQISEQIRQSITSGEIAAGALFPGEIDLARAWVVSRPTVRRAFDELVRAGLVQRRRGLGTMVVRPEIRRDSKLSSLYDDLMRLNRAPSTVVLSMTKLRATGGIAEQLEVAEGTAVLSLRRVRFADGTGLALLQNFLPYDVVQGITREDLEADGLYSLLRTHGCQPADTVQLVGARLARRQEAHHLGISEGAPVLTVDRITRDSDGRLIDLGRHVYDASQHLFEMHISTK